MAQIRYILRSTHDFPGRLDTQDDFERYLPTASYGIRDAAGAEIPIVNDFNCNDIVTLPQFDDHIRLSAMMFPCIAFLSASRLSVLR